MLPLHTSYLRGCFYVDGSTDKTSTVRCLISNQFAFENLFGRILDDSHVPEEFTIYIDVESARGVLVLRMSLIRLEARKLDDPSITCVAISHCPKDPATSGSIGTEVDAYLIQLNLSRASRCFGAFHPTQCSRDMEVRRL